MSDKLRYLCDTGRHLICLPFTVDNLHRMADDLQIGRHYFHYKNKKIPNSRPRPHYDIPERRIKEITGKCEVVEKSLIVKIIEEWRIENNV